MREEDIVNIWGEHCQDILNFVRSGGSESALQSALHQVTLEDP